MRARARVCDSSSTHLRRVGDRDPSHGRQAGGARVRGSAARYALCLSLSVCLCVCLSSRCTGRQIPHGHRDERDGCSARQHVHPALRRLLCLPVPVSVCLWSVCCQSVSLARLAGALAGCRSVHRPQQAGLLCEAASRAAVHGCAAVPCALSLHQCDSACSCSHDSAILLRSRLLSSRERPDDLTSRFDRDSCIHIEN